MNLQPKSLTRLCWKWQVLWNRVDAFIWINVYSTSHFSRNFKRGQWDGYLYLYGQAVCGFNPPIDSEQYDTFQRGREYRSITFLSDTLLLIRYLGKFCTGVSIKLARKLGRNLVALALKLLCGVWKSATILAHTHSWTYCKWLT